MTTIEIKVEQHGDWAFPEEGLTVYHQGLRVPLTPQQVLFLRALARNGQTMRTMALVARISPGASEKLGHVLACNIRKRLRPLMIEPPFDNMFDRHDMLGVKRDARKGRVVSGYKWIG